MLFFVRTFLILFINFGFVQSICAQDFFQAAGNILSQLSWESGDKKCDPIAIIDLEQKLSRLEKNEGSGTDLKSTALRLAEHQLYCRQAQELIWALQRAGYAAESEMLIKRMRQTLEDSYNAQAQHIDYVLKRTHQDVPYISQVINIANGVRAIVKSREPNWYGSTHYEQFAYDLDQFLGFYRVPITINVPCGVPEKGSFCSVQLLIEGASELNIHYALHRYQAQFLQNWGEVYTFDFLIDNEDRHGANSLKSFSSRQVLIDHGRIFATIHESVSPTSNPERFIDRLAEMPKSHLLRLYAISELELKSKFSSLLAPKEMEDFIEKVRTLKAFFPEEKLLNPPLDVHQFDDKTLEGFRQCLEILRRSN